MNGTQVWWRYICRCSVLTRALWCCTPPATTARHVWLWTMDLDSQAPPPVRSDWLLYCAWARLLGIARWWLLGFDVCHWLWFPPPTCTSWTPLIGRGVHGNTRLLDTSEQRWKMTDFIYRIMHMSYFYSLMICFSIWNINRSAAAIFWI